MIEQCEPLDKELFFKFRELSSTVQRDSKTGKGRIITTFASSSRRSCALAVDSDPVGCGL